MFELDPRILPPIYTNPLFRVTIFNLFNNIEGLFFSVLIFKKRPNQNPKSNKKRSEFHLIHLFSDMEIERKRAIKPITSSLLSCWTIPNPLFIYFISIFIPSSIEENKYRNNCHFLWFLVPASTNKYFLIIWVLFDHWGYDTLKCLIYIAMHADIGQLDLQNVFE